MAGRSDLGRRRQGGGRLFADDFDENPLAAAAVELAIKDLFPGAEVEVALGDGDDDFASHDLAFHVGIGVVFAGPVVAVLGGGGMGGEFFQPVIVILDQSILGIIDEDTGGDVHGVDEAEPLLDATALEQRGNGLGDVQVIPAVGSLEPKVFSEAFHGIGMPAAGGRRNAGFVAGGMFHTKARRHEDTKGETAGVRWEGERTANGRQ